LFTLIRLFLSSRAALVAENLFLRKQLALFLEREAKRRRTTRAIRVAMVALARFFDWQRALVVVKPETFINWHRTAFSDILATEVTRARPPAPAEKSQSPDP